MKALIIIGSTVNQSVGTSTAATQVFSGNPQNSSAQVLLTNVGSNTVFVAFGDSTVTTTVTAGCPLLANSAQTFSVKATDTHFAAISAATGNTLYATPGQGL